MENEWKNLEDRMFYSSSYTCYVEEGTSYEHRFLLASPFQPMTLEGRKGRADIPTHVYDEHQSYT